MPNSPQYQLISEAQTLSPSSYQELVHGYLTEHLNLARETLELDQLLGRTLAEDIVAHEPIPAFANSQMDGYALTEAATSSEDRVFRVGADLPAGRSPQQVEIDDCLVYPIMTGAPLPAGYVAVIPEEHAEPLGQQAGTFAAEGSRVRLPSTNVGAFVRQPGEDTATGQLLIPANTVLTPIHIGVLAQHGIASAPVRRSLSALVLTGGDEVTTDHATEFGTIRDANGPMLCALLQDDAVAATRVQISDDPVQLVKILEEKLAAEHFDLVISSGGISHGKYEVIKQAAQHLYREESKFLCLEKSWFGHVSQQPGGPQGLMVLASSQQLKIQQRLIWLAFPGNPVSTLVAYRLILHPYLREISGRNTKPQYGKLISAEPIEGLNGKTQYRRGHATVHHHSNGDSFVELRLDPLTGSHLLHRASYANALIELEPNNSYRTNDILRWYPLSHYEKREQ